MKTNMTSSLKIAALAIALTWAAGARATTVPAALGFNPTGSSDYALMPAAFRDSAEANLLRNAYQILATGDHDYKGHRVKAMHAVEAAAKRLGMDLAGDLKDRTPQPLSDAKLREAQGLITQVLGSAEVKGQKRVVKRLNEAVTEIDTALSVR